MNYFKQFQNFKNFLNYEPLNLGVKAFSNEFNFEKIDNLFKIICKLFFYSVVSIFAKLAAKLLRL